jgi:hypothetical protein
MPYKSVKQAAYIHAAAARGEKWAIKWVKDSHGTHVPKKGRKKLKRAKTKS